MILQQLLAMELNQAMELCRQAKWDVKVEYTAPPGKQIHGVPRVVRCQRYGDSVVVITAAREMDK